MKIPERLQQICDIQCRNRAMTPFRSRVMRIAAASIFTGLTIGLVGGAFRYLLLDADRLRDLLVYCKRVFQAVWR